VNALSTHLPGSADQDLERRVRLFLQQRRLTSGARLSVTSDRGAVTLQGTVSTFHQRQLLVSFARRVAGAIRVIDELDVEPESASKSSAARRNNSDGEPESQVSPSRRGSLRDPQPPKSELRESVVALAVFLVVAAGMALAGCSRSGPQRAETHPVQGKITFQGQPIGGAFVVLHPKEAATPEVPTATALVQPDGTFAVSTYDSADGAPVGEYVVTVQWQKLAKSGGDFVPGPNLLPAKYSDPATSNVIVQVAAGRNELPPIALKR